MLVIEDILTSKNHNVLVSVLESINPDTINHSKHNEFIKNKSIWIDDCYDPAMKLCSENFVQKFY